MIFHDTTYVLHDKVHRINYVSPIRFNPLLFNMKNTYCANTICKCKYYLCLCVTFHKQWRGRIYKKFLLNGLRNTTIDWNYCNDRHLFIHIFPSNKYILCPQYENNRSMGIHQTTNQNINWYVTLANSFCYYELMISVQLASKSYLQSEEKIFLCLGINISSWMCMIWPSLPFSCSLA